MSTWMSLWIQPRIGMVLYLFAIYYKHIYLLSPSITFWHLHFFHSEALLSISYWRIQSAECKWMLSTQLQVGPRTREHFRSRTEKNVRSGGCEQCQEMLSFRQDMTLVFMTKSQWILMIGNLYGPSWIEDVPTRIHPFLWTH